MKKLEMNKKTIIILAAIAVLIIAVVIGIAMCGKKEQEGSDKNKSEKDNVKTEQNDDKDDDKDDENASGNDTVDQEGGLQIMGPEEADEQEDTNKVEFVNPDGNSNGTTDGENPSGEGDKEDKEENPGETDDDEEIKYGEIY